MRRTIVTLVFTCLVTACGERSTAPVDVSGGSVQGLVEDGLIIYRNVPYAAPPVGDLRWRAPQPVEPWEGVRSATQFGPACWQSTTGGDAMFLERLTEGAGMGAFATWLLKTTASWTAPEISEDCLSLNIMAPEGGQGLPVMFWIHGGGHQFGSGGQAYESPSLVREGVVLVSINYRLGLYGFMAHPELSAEDPSGSSGNYGMLDQIAALAWVRANILKFGGDPNNVTIFGESAGGHSVGQLMASPLTQGLFQRAIAQSGTGLHQFQAVGAAFERTSGHEVGRQIALAAGVAGPQEIEALRAMTTEELRPYAIDPEFTDTFHPQIDGHVLPRSTAQTFFEGKQQPVPLIVGSNADEGSVLYYFGIPAVEGGPMAQPQNRSEWDELLASQFAEQAPRVDAAYTIDGDADVPRAAEQLMGDTLFGRHAFYMAQRHQAAGHPAYLYFYERRPPSETQTLGATHALEISHVFGGLIPLWPTDERDDELQAQMQGYWSEFAKSGDPNRDDLPDWIAFDDLDPLEMAFGHERSYGRRTAREDRYRAMAGQFESRLAAALISAD